jgi:hypothetical protein
MNLESQLTRTDNLILALVLAATFGTGMLLRGVFRNRSNRVWIFRSTAPFVVAVAAVGTLDLVGEKYWPIIAGLALLAIIGLTAIRLQNAGLVQRVSFKRILNVFRSGARPKVPLAMPPDPAKEFTDPENQWLFARFKEDSQVADSDEPTLYILGGYKIRAHPDLVEILYDLLSESEVRKGSAYGRPVIANNRGLVFAYAGGTLYFFQVT